MEDDVCVNKLGGIMGLVLDKVEQKFRNTPQPLQDTVIKVRSSLRVLHSFHITNGL